MGKLLAAMGCALALGGPASAVSIDWVTVGDPGNLCDNHLQGCFGSVADTYRIGKYEVSNTQYAEFLNAVAARDTKRLYNTAMGSHSYGGITRSGSWGSYTYSAISGREGMPVNFVSFYDALRFANWLHNGQPTGVQDSSTTEDGAYTMIVEDYYAGRVITRNAGATIFLTSEDEWYKAAYYDASALGYNPYPFADGFNGAVCEVPAGTTSHSANCNLIEGDLTDVGAYTGSPSEYGSFDQGGNVSEWNEAIISTSNRGSSGGAFDLFPSFIAASFRGDGSVPTFEYSTRGFRVASIPEPGTGLLLMVGVLGLSAWRRRSA